MIRYRKCGVLPPLQAISLICPACSADGRVYKPLISMDSTNTSRSASNNDAINEIRNDPDVYMEIRPARNSNACANCRKKKKRCELGPDGANTTCKRCSDNGIECKYYERASGEQAASSNLDLIAPPSPPPPWPPGPPRNPTGPPGPWPVPGTYPPGQSSTPLPFPPGNREAGASYSLADHLRPHVTVAPHLGYVGGTSATSYPNSFPTGNNSSHSNNQGTTMTSFPDPITSMPCECTRTSTCDFHRWTTPSNSTSLKDWNPSYYPKNI